jgi:UDP-GlcNAc:undecaprenyl-phosphate/decaprenyl-phosphate GlcNAc-1-phosphate transferase
MSVQASAVVGFACAAILSFALTPLAIRIARRTDFLDYPRQYRQHAAPTPLLGGAVVLVAFLIAALVIGGAAGSLLVLLGGACVMCLIGTVDDRVAVAPIWRVLVTGGAACALYAAGLGWDTAAGSAVDLAVTVLWMVGLVNAFNLMDNLDGACGTVAAVASVGIGIFAAVKGDAAIAGLALALAGACAGFLPWNLAGPAKIFLGDGGSMPVGFLVAALAMATARLSPNGHAGLLAGALLVALPMLDTALVIVSRTRRGVTLVTGGRDHLTHRLLLTLGTPRAVAVALAVTQAALSTLAILGFEWGTGALLGFAFLAFAAAIAATLTLDTARWRPAEIAYGPAEPVAQQDAEHAPVGVDSA